MRTKPLPLTRSVAFSAVALLFGMMLGGSAAAQSASPASTPVGPTEGYPVALHQGTCDDLTEQPEYTLDNAVTYGSGDDDADVDTIGTGPAVPVVLSVSNTLDTSLDDLASDGYAIAVHKSADEYAEIVACGNVAGVKDDGKLVVALNSLDNNSIVGIAILNEDNSGVLGLGDDEVQATIYIFDSEDTGDATPSA